MFLSFSFFFVVIGAIFSRPENSDKSSIGKIKFSVLFFWGYIVVYLQPTSVPTYCFMFFSIGNMLWGF